MPALGASLFQIFKKEHMSDLDKLTFPDSVRYSKEHTWARVDGHTVTIGISDFAQDELGEIVFIEFPEVGTS